MRRRSGIWIAALSWRNNSKEEKIIKTSKLLSSNEYQICVDRWRRREGKKKKKKMGRVDYLAMKTDVDTVALVNSDVEELKIAAKKLVSDVTKLGGLAFGVSFLRWLACFSAM